MAILGLLDIEYACAEGGTHLPMAPALRLPEPTNLKKKCFKSFFLVLTKLKVRKNYLKKKFWMGDLCEKCVK